MKMVGHKTESIYRRYAIADEAMLKESAEKLARLHQADQVAGSHRLVPLEGIIRGERAKHGHSNAEQGAAG